MKRRGDVLSRESRYWWINSHIIFDSVRKWSMWIVMKVFLIANAQNFVLCWNQIWRLGAATSAFIRVKGWWRGFVLFSNANAVVWFWWDISKPNNHKKYQENGCPCQNLCESEEYLEVIEDSAASMTNLISLLLSNCSFSAFCNESAGNTQFWIQ